MESGELSGKCIELNTDERTAKTEIDAKSGIKRSGEAQLVDVKGGKI